MGKKDDRVRKTQMKKHVSEKKHCEKRAGIKKR